MIAFANETIKNGTAELQTLWAECFGDSPEDIRFYFEYAFVPDQTLVYLEQDVPVAMLTMIPVDVSTPLGSLEGRYIYAVGTAKASRGRGISTQLLEYAHEHMKAQGICLSFLVPASVSLFEYYEKRGYQTAFYLGEAEVSADRLERYFGECRIKPASVQEFFEIRAAAFGDRTLFPQWSAEQLAYRQMEAERYGGEVLHLTGGGAQAVAVCYLQGTILSVTDLALDGMSLQTAAGILHERYQAEQYRFRLPSDAALPAGWTMNIRPFGCVKWYDATWKKRLERCTAPVPYIGLVLD